MTDLENAVNYLISITKKSPDMNFHHYLNKAHEDIYEAGLKADNADRNRALSRMASLIPKVGSITAAVVALCCGFLVEHGADPLIAFQPVILRLEEIIADAIPFGKACQEEGVFSGDVDNPEELMEAVQIKMPDNGQAWEALKLFYLAAIAMLSRSKQARQIMRTKESLQGQIIELKDINEGAHWLYIMMRVMDAEEILVLHPEHKHGYRIQISGIADNYQLQILLADALIGNEDEGWLPGERPDPQIVNLFRNQNIYRQEGVSTAYGVFNLVNWDGLQPDGTLPANVTSESWIWSEGSPIDIRKFEGRRIILLQPQPYQRTWNAVRQFSGMIGELEVLEKLSQEEVNDWLSRIANANKK
ncbi:MAG: hypothetical protein ACFFC7_11480 [Candidatus Hermodarchaeota archaeon]